MAPLPWHDGLSIKKEKEQRVREIFWRSRRLSSLLPLQTLLLLPHSRFPYYLSCLIVKIGPPQNIWRLHWGGKRASRKKKLIPTHSPKADIEEHENDFNEEEEDEDNGDGDEDENDVVSQRSPLSRLCEQRFGMETLSQQLSSELVLIRVHDVLIRDNAKTKDWVIEAELKGIKDTATTQDLGLGIFDPTNLRLESEPPNLPRTTNVVVDIVEAANKVLKDDMEEPLVARLTFKDNLQPTQ